MNKVIGGKKYSTETARELGSRSEGFDINFCEETLYVTKSGNYFLHCAGGANTRYGVWDNDRGKAGEKIEPMSQEQAQKWAEEYMTADEYESAFGEINEDKVKISADVAPTAKEKLESLKNQKMKSNGDVIEYLLTLIPKTK